MRVATVPNWHSDPEKRCCVNDRPHRYLGDAERDHCWGMAVDHRLHVRPRFIDFTMDEPLDDASAVLRINRIGIEVVLHDVARCDQDRRACGTTDNGWDRSDGGC